MIPCSSSDHSHLTFMVLGARAGSASACSALAHGHAPGQDVVDIQVLVDVDVTLHDCSRGLSCWSWWAPCLVLRSCLPSQDLASRGAFS